MKLNLISSRYAVAVAAGLAASILSSQAQSASATISYVPVAGSFDYTIILKNTGSDNLNSFWYGWTQSGNNLPTDPVSPGNSSGWANDLSGNSIMWINSSGTPLSPGNTATFTFDSTATPLAITTPPSGESVAYVGGIDFSQGVAGDSTGVFSPVLVSVPEPSTFGLLAIGSLGFWGALLPQVPRLIIARLRFSREC